MEKNVKLSIQDIYNKKFEKDVKGYNPDEVDAFLDLIIQDYDAYEKALAQCEARTNELIETEKARAAKVEEIIQRSQKDNEELRKLEVENASLKKRVGGIKPSDNVSEENLAKIQRIHELENFIYSIGYDPRTLTKRN